MTMNKICKGWIPTAVLAATMLFGSTVANADGVIIGGFANTGGDPCSVNNQKIDSGVIIGGLRGVIIGGFAGVIIGGYANSGIIVTDLKAGDTTVNCGVIIGG